LIFFDFLGLIWECLFENIIMVKPVTRNSKALSGIQRAAGGEMADAKPVSEWTCEVIATNRGV
jgi:hypothetical protein